VIVGLNPTVRGAELAAGIAHTDCQLVVTERRHRPLLGGLDLPVGPDRVFEVDAPGYADAVAAFAGAPMPAVERDPGELFMLIFTSGTSGQPKAVRCTHRKVAFPGVNLSERFGLGPDDVCYLSMPMFHSNAMMAGWGPALAAGATMAFRRRFSASGFLPDVRRYGVTYFNYVGKPLSYILATEERPDDADNPLRVAFGNEASDRDIAEFSRRFDCTVWDGFGSSEGAIIITREDGCPPGSLGQGFPGVSIYNPDTLAECAVAEFDDDGALVNPDDAIGELVNTTGAGLFAGYYNDKDATDARLRNGMFWSGDLAYRDADGWIYFAGRSGDWLRVDSENFAAGPVEVLLSRHPDISVLAVYPVPDTVSGAGDQVMVALETVPGRPFDPEGFATWLSEQPDLGTKWVPRYVRVSASLPQTATGKVTKVDLRQEAWACDDPVWWRPLDSTELRFVPLREDDRAALAKGLAENGRPPVGAAHG
jgi:fatty-acyl-CoA synthase